MRLYLFELSIITTMLAFNSLSATPENSWPQFRGPGARGISTNAHLPERWSATENVAWKTDVPGRGWSSPIVWGERVFLTTAISSGELEPPKKGLYFGGERKNAPRPEHQWKVVCFELSTGKMRWEKLIHRAEPAGPIHLKNTYASETPTTDGERIYAYVGNAGLFCLDMEGKTLWSNRFEPHPLRAGWGTAASPVLFGERIFVVNDNDEHSYIGAFDGRTGKELWKVDRDEKSNWSTPFIWQNSDRTELVTAGSGKVRSYDLDGKLLWWLKGMSSITIATPYADQGLLYLSSGYVMDSSRPLYAIRPGAKGDISLESGATNSPAIAWCQRHGAPYNPTTLVYDGVLYVLHDRGVLSAYTASTGAVLYDKERLPEGLHFTSSPWGYGGRVFCLNEDGLTFVLRAGPHFELLHTNKLGEDDMCLASPALVGDRVLIRTAARLYCIGKGK